MQSTQSVVSGIEGKVIALTGASSGIGEATAKHLAQRGAKVVLGARSEQQLKRIRGGIEASGGTAVDITVDVRKREQVERLVAFALEHYGRLDVLVNNAGVAPTSRFDELRVEDWDEMIDVNLRGVLYGIAAALPVFRRQGVGHFINTISTAGLKIVPTQGIYAATKNAVRTLTEALRQEAGPTLRVTGISPGFVMTNLASSMTDPATKSQVEERMRQIAISPDAVARAIAFAIEQPQDVDVGDIVIRPTAQD